MRYVPAGRLNIRGVYQPEPLRPFIVMALPGIFDWITIFPLGTCSDPCEPSVKPLSRLPRPVLSATGLEVVDGVVPESWAEGSDSSLEDGADPDSPRELPSTSS